MADVLNYRLMLSKHFQSVTLTSSTPNMAASCRRCLFGRPDADELQRDLQQHLDRQEQQKIKRWNFDFKSGRPLAGRIIWQAVNAVKRNPESCGVLPLKEDGSGDDDHMGGERLEPVDTSTAPSATTTTPPQHHSIASLTGGSAAAVDVTRFPLTPSDARSKLRRTTPTHRDAGKLKQPRHSTRRRTICRRRAQLVNTAGAARVTGQCLLILRLFTVIFIMLSASGRSAIYR